MMVDTQVRPSDVTQFPIIDAMLSVPRERYVPEAAEEAAYMGEHIPLGHGRVILDPRTLAKMLEELRLDLADVVLDLGCGLGYSTAVIARMADAVVAIEPDEARAEEAQKILSTEGVDNAAVISGPLAEGHAKSGPYDAIILQGAVQSVPDALTDQLKDGGRIAAIFMDGALGTVKIGHRIDGRMSWAFAFNAGAPVLEGFEKEVAFAF